MTTMVLPQLVEAEAQLAAEEAALNQQLAELQDKIKGIQTVIAMFNGGEPATNGKVPAAAVAEVAEVVEAAPEAPAPKKAAVEKKVPAKKTGRVGRPKKTAAEKASTATAKKAATAKKTTTTKKAKAAPAKKTAAKTAAKTTTKRGGKSSNWQSYVRDDFSKTPLPDIVENILKAQPKSVFKIAAVMSEIFPDDMPKNHFLKARNRISNILSAGARSGEWHRGRGGTYSCSEKSLKTA